MTTHWSLVLQEAAHSSLARSRHSPEEHFPSPSPGILFVFVKQGELSQQSRGCHSAWHDWLGLPLNDVKGGTSFVLMLSSTLLLGPLFFFFWSLKNNFSSFVENLFPIHDRWGHRRMTSSPSCKVSDLARYSILVKIPSCSYFAQLQSRASRHFTDSTQQFFLRQWSDRAHARSPTVKTVKPPLVLKPCWWPRVAAKRDYSFATYF